ncbi:MAG TPA: radical SAM protein, partial [Gemmataceae bacterium]|nr:radical SAM protein [Gemmataceae bacterium]
MATPPRGDARHVHLVQPQFPPSYWGMSHFLEMTPFRAVFPPLGLLTLAAVTPPEFRVTLEDENAGEAIDYDTPAGIVGVTGYIIQMDRVFAIADRYRERGKLVVLGGPLANLMPEECRPHCDVLFHGEAEYTWPRFLREFAAGRWADHYEEHDKIHLPDSPPPRLDVLKQRYAHGIVQCSRGCPFTCEFCDIIVMYGRKMRFKPVEQVLREVRAWKELGVGQVFFADDNFIGNRAYAKDLLRALARWNRRQRNALSFYTQASIDMVRDDELLGLLRDANFVSVFIGIESPRKSSLAETHKTQNEKLDLVAAVHKIQSYNLFISAGMIVGFDNDDPSIFDEQYDFLQAAQIPIVMLSALLAVPRTPLYQRLQAAGRLRTFRATGTSASRFVGTNGGTNFEPLHMTVDELRAGQQRLYQRLYAPEAFAHRLLGNLSRFHDVRYRPEKLRAENVRTLLRLIGHYWKKGNGARKFFWSTLGKTL